MKFAFGLGLGMAPLLKGVGDPTLLWDEDFANQVYRYNRVRYPVVTDLPMTTFTRASGGYGVNSAGLLVWFAAGVPRATDAGLTVEPTATNLLLRSQDFSHSVWDKGTGGAISADSVLAPDGTMTADAYTWATTTGSYAYLSQTISGDASVAVASAIYLKVPSGTRNVKLAISNISGATVNSANMTLTTAWQRIPYAIAAAALANTGQIGFGLLAGNTNPVVAGEVVHVWGAQLELGSTATSYTPTTTAAVTRNADVLASTDSVISPTVVAEFTVPTSGPTTGYPRVFSWNDGTTNNNVEIYLDRVYLNLYGGVRAGGADQAFLFLGAVTLGSSHKVAMRVATNDFAASRNGAAVVTDTSVTLPVPSVFRVGDDYTLTRAWGPGIRRIRRYSVAKTDSQLRDLST